MHRCTKTFGHERGISVCFRQWRAKSHCSFLHGYALSFRIEFQARELDERNWVVDFGAMKPLKDAIEKMFDHKTVAAYDDPQLPWLREAMDRGLCNLVVVQAVGCEAFAEAVFQLADVWLTAEGLKPRVSVASVEAREHDSNGAIFAPGPVT